jgi:hypothetical protein
LDPDPDVDPSIFIIDLQDASKKRIFVKKLFEGTFTSFFNHKKSKRRHSFWGWGEIEFMWMGAVLVFLKSSVADP